MAGALQNTPPARAWRFPLTIGLTVGLALPVAQGVAEALAPGLGYWGASAVSVVAAGLVGGLVALAVLWLVKPRGGRA
jgi:hypothetical protein